MEKTWENLAFQQLSNQFLTTVVVWFHIRPSLSGFLPSGWERLDKHSTSCIPYYVQHETSKSSHGREHCDLAWFYGVFQLRFCTELAPPCKPWASCHQMSVQRRPLILVHCCAYGPDRFPLATWIGSQLELCKRNLGGQLPVASPKLDVEYYILWYHVALRCIFLEESMCIIKHHQVSMFPLHLNDLFPCTSPHRLHHGLLIGFLKCQCMDVFRHLSRPSAHSRITYEHISLWLFCSFPGNYIENSQTWAFEETLAKEVKQDEIRTVPSTKLLTHSPCIQASQ